MEENLQNVLGIEKTDVAKKETNTQEKTLKTFGNVFIVVGIISTFIILAATYEAGVFFPTGLIYGIGTLLFSLVTWAFFSVIAKISITLTEIRDLLKK